MTPVHARIIGRVPETQSARSDNGPPPITVGALDNCASAAPEGAGPIRVPRHHFEAAIAAEDVFHWPEKRFAAAEPPAKK